MHQVPIDPGPDIRHADGASPRVAAAIEPSADLLDRAQAGWERFLNTFEELPDE